jgi:iron complex outermembrane receptor protein
LAADEHVVEFGLQQDSYRLRTLVSSTADWLHGDAGARYSVFNGNTGLRSLYLQDTWRFAPDWKASLGVRDERWQAWGGELGNAAGVVPFGNTRDERHVSPKAALAWQLDDAWAFKSAVGRAVRMPTASELYQGAIVGDAIVNTDPNLRPEKSWTVEAGIERTGEGSAWRATLFAERTRDALYSQPLTATVSTVQNVDAIRTQGAELSWQASDLGARGFDLAASLTYADSIITANARNPASVGKRQPRVPLWRANAVATWRPSDRWSATLAARYGGRQYGQLDNSDTHGDAYTAFSSFFVVDARLHVRIDRRWSAAVGIDNLNNCRYWAFHPYPQRTLTADLKFDL